VSDSAIGPSLSATLVTDRLDTCVAAWAEFLDHHPGAESPLPDGTARRWTAPRLSGARSVWLHNALGEPWLRLVEDEVATPRPPFCNPGWQALEIAVADVDGLARRLAGSPFTCLGEPANLDVSDAIRAMQVLGPAGEVLYLTEVRDAVPGFELPGARCPVDRLFIPVLLAPDRASASACYGALGGPAPLNFDTRIGVLNRARGLAADTRHPVATLQLAGANLIEIDEVPGLPGPAAGLPPGIASVAFAAPSQAVPANADGCLGKGVDDDAPYAGHTAHSFRGAAGEHFELIEH
jgi:hypothetical protein